MDRIPASEAGDTGSIPVEGTPKADVRPVKLTSFISIMLVLMKTALEFGVRLYKA